MDRILQLLSLVLFAGCLLFTAFRFEAYDLLWMMLPLLRYGGYSIAICMAIAACWHVVLQHLVGDPIAVRRAIRTLLWVAASISLGCYMLSADRLSERIKMWRVQSTYQQALASNDGADCAVLDMRRDDVDLRIVVFPWGGGVMDNWWGAVFDPTGTIYAGINPGRFGASKQFCNEYSEGWFVCYFN
jgi:hypothetical protein